MIKFNKHPLQKTFSIIKLLPNFLTLMALTIGLNSFKMALDGNWEKAVGCIIIAAIVDTLDGKLARLLDATSSFGAELDSLCDFINFGVCPVFVMYLWLYNVLPISFLWSSIVIYAICMAIRLARFNTNLENPSKILKLFFIGVPAPAGAILVLMPLILSFDILQDLSIDYTQYVLLIPFYIISVGALTSSTIPTFALKNVYIKREYVWIVMLIFGIVALEMFLHPWYAIPLLSIIYCASIVMSFFAAKKISKQEANNPPQDNSSP